MDGVLPFQKINSIVFFCFLLVEETDKEQANANTRRQNPPTPPPPPPFDKHTRVQMPNTEREGGGGLREREGG